MQSPARINKTIFFLVLHFIVISAVLGVVAAIYDINMIIIAGISQFAGLFLPFLFYLLLTKQSFKKVLPWRGLSLNNAVLVAILSFAILPMVQVLFHLLSLVFVPVITDVLEEVHTAPVWLSVLCIGVLPSLFEEFWFRGAMYTEYRAKGVSIHKTVIITALFFGLIHMNFQQVVYAAAIGALYAYLVYYTRSILAPVLGHFINNSMAVILMYIEPYQVWHRNLSENSLNFLFVMGFASLVMMPVAIYCMRRLKKYHRSTEPMGETEAIAIPLPKPKVYTWGFWAVVVVLGLMTLIIEIGLHVL